MVPDLESDADRTALLDLVATAAMEHHGSGGVRGRVGHGEPDGSPTKGGAAFVDISGGIHLFAAISAALFQRERTGGGQIVEVPRHDIIYPRIEATRYGLRGQGPHAPL